MIKPDIIYQTKRRTLSISILPNGKLVMRIPQNFDKNKAFEFLNSKQKWIEKRQNEILEVNRFYSEIIDLKQVLFLGKSYDVNIIYGKGDTQLTPNGLCIYTVNKLFVKKYIKNWYIDIANSVLIKKIDFYSNLLKVDFDAIHYINSKAKWGMCDCKKNIYFNIKCSMLENDIIDYIIVHELAHLKHLNHSTDFWNEVKKYIPDYKRRIDKLKKCNFALHLF